MTKICNKCKVEKEAAQFYKNKTGKYGLHVECKSCSCLRTKKHTANNKEKRYAYNKQWKLDNADTVADYNKKYCADYYSKNKAELIPKMTAYTTHSRRTKIEVRLASNLRRRINHIIKGAVKGGSSIRDLGCSVEELVTYLESRFSDGMTWSNYGFGQDRWNVDHIRALSKFNLANREEFLVACHYTNLQPLWQTQNFSKNNR